MEFVGEQRRRRIPNGATLFSAYASLSTTFTLLQQAFYQFVPPFVQVYICDLFKKWFFRKPPSKDLFELIIEEREDDDDEFFCNTIFEACHIYLRNKFSDCSNVLKVARAQHEETMSFKLSGGVNYSDTFEGILLKWRFYYVPPFSSSADEESDSDARSYFSLTFDKEHKNKVCYSYLPYVVRTSEEIAREAKLLKLCDCITNYDNVMGEDEEDSVNMTHPFTFENLAMDPESKKAIVDDLDRFMRRKEFYRRVGKPWKRGYLLYGPPGTGKSSLIVAMANYLKFDIYDMPLGHIDDSFLRELLLCIPSRSITVVEDIDCNRGLPGRTLYEGFDDPPKTKNEPQMSLVALLNFVDGLWSCCGDERLIVFTTNHKEKLDPALLRPGRMDMHIHMSYLTMEGFKVLAYNYLQLSTNHQLFGEIKSLLETVNASPAEVAEELMRSEDVDMALQGVVDLLKRKRSEAEDATSLKLQAEKDGEDAESASCDKVEEGKYADEKSEAEVQSRWESHMGLCLSWRLFPLIQCVQDVLKKDLHILRFCLYRGWR